MTARNGPGSFGVQCLLAGLAVAGIAYLLSADPPWELEIHERLAEGKSWRIRDYAAYYSWWAALVNVCVLAFLLALSRWWAPAPADGPAVGPRPVRYPAWFWLGTLAAVVLAAFWRVPRLDHAFWNDEEYGVRRYVWGEYDKQPDEFALRQDPAPDLAHTSVTGPLVFDRLTWQETLFGCTSGNNHLWSAFEARLAQSIQEAAAGPDPPDFSETALRLPALVASLLTVGVLALLGARCGAPLAGLGAAFLLALSPWHVRYSVEVRGYASLLFFILLALLCVVRAIETGRWRWWLGFALAQAAFLLCFAGALYVAVGLNVAVAVLLFSRWRRSRNAVLPIGRWMVANGLSGVLVLQWMLPSIPQVLEYLHKDDHLRPDELGLAWFLDLWSHLVLGVQWSMTHDVPHHGLGFHDLAKDSPAIWWGVVVIVPVLFLVGLVRMARSGWRERIVLAALIGGALLSYKHNDFADSKMFTWYLLFAVPGLVLCLALAVVGPGVGMAGRDGPAGVRRWAGPVLLGLLVGGYGWMTADPRRRLVGFERQPMGEVVRYARGVAHSGTLAESPVLTATFGVSDRQIQSYDPRVALLEEPGDLEALEERARREGLPLFVYVCGPTESRERRPELHAAVVESGKYELAAEFPALEPYFSYVVHRLRSATGPPAEGAENTDSVSDAERGGRADSGGSR